MKSTKIYLAVLGIFILSACNKVLDKSDQTKLDPAYVFNDSNLVQLNMDNIYYNNQPLFGGENTSKSVLSGTHTELSEEGYASNNVYMNGTMSFGSNEPTDFGTALNSSNQTPTVSWGKIRQLNTFIVSVENSSLPDYTKRKFEAQAKFWRAWRYWDMVRMYGGVPLVLTPLEGVGQAARDSAFLPRNKTSECFAQIVKDLDYAIANLPGNWPSSSDWGKITSGAAAAFKGRVLLLYASPMFNPNDLPERWQAAYDANVAAVNILTANGYGLYNNYKTMWFKEVNNPEAVMVTVYNNITADQEKRNNGWDKSCRPANMLGSGSNLPTWEMVMSYPMKDGKMPGASANYPYYDTLYYKDRDPRFDASIAYNGCIWPLDGNTNRKQWTYFYTSSKSTEGNSYSGTGFYCRKAVSEASFPGGDPTYSGTDWMEIRYAEVLLNLAESAVGIGKTGIDDEGYQGIIAVRKRAGIEAGPDNLYGLDAGMSRDQLFDAILFERKIEFAFEGKRFWDLYRWKRLSDLSGWTRNKVKIVLKSGSGIPTEGSLTDATNSNYRDVQNLDSLMANDFTMIRNDNHDASNSTTKLDTYPIDFSSQYYFFPIPLKAINNNPNLAQNNNWGGSFDPLE